MAFVWFFLLAIASCQCAVDFSDRPRNFSIEILYYTQKETNGHVVISPFGIWTLMTGVALGASGESYKQLSTACILPKKKAILLNGYKNLISVVLEPKTNGVSLTSKNFMFLDNDFNVLHNYKTNIQNDFSATVKVLDFQDPNSANIANTFIEKSGGRVSNVLRSDDFAKSKMILTNVISFEGLWTFPFNVTETVREPFYNDDKTVIGSVNMMHQKAPFLYSNIIELESYAVELPYGDDNKYSMVVILPYRNKKVNDIYKNFATYSLKDVFKQFQLDVDTFGLGDIDVKIPRFHIQTNLVMNKPLNDMGVYDIFDPNMANFKRMTNDNIFVSSIVHKADIEVTESGTVASAASSAFFSYKMSDPTFYANKPFVYFVVEKTTTTIIFGGIYSKPTVY